MPRIREVKLDRFNEVQDIASDATIEITSRPNDDLLRAVGADYADGIQSPPRSSDVFAAWENGYGYAAAGLLSGATECTHVDAVCWAHAFNSRGVIRSGSWVVGASGREGQVTRTPTSPADLGPTPRGRVKVCWGYCDVSEVEVSTLREVAFYDPRGDVYRAPDWADWETWHRDRGTVCPSCDAVNYEVESESTCANCLAPMAQGWPAGMESGELDSMVYGYVTALTWTDLQRACELCEGTGVDPKTADGLEADRVDCPDCEGSGGAEESGSDPYEYGPDDLEADALAEIRSDVADFYRANWRDLRAWADQFGSERSDANGHTYGAMESAGCMLYWDAAGHGSGFGDDSTPAYVVGHDLREEDGRYVFYWRVGVPAMMEIVNAPRRAWCDLLSRLSGAACVYSVPTLFLDSEGKVSA